MTYKGQKKSFTATYIIWRYDRMKKPSMFSSKYHQQVKRRRLNKFLFVLLIICIAFFSGKYYLNKQNIYPVKSITNLGFVKNIKLGNWWNDITKKFKTSDTAKKPIKVVNPIAPKTTTTVQAVIPAVKKVEPILSTYTYTDGNNVRYNVTYQKTDKGILITGFNEPNNTSEYCISNDKSKLVFDIKSTSSLILCDSTGKFTDITRASYKTKSTGKIISKQSAISSYKGYIWAEKPFFTLDGRVIYISRLPFIREDGTLYLWTENIDGTNYKHVYKLGSDKSIIAYGGYDASGRLIVKIKGVNYYLDKGSYMLKNK